MISDLKISEKAETYFPKWMDRRFTNTSIINVLIVCARFEPEFAGVGKESQAEE
jgi:hypothetical protein